MKSLALDSDVVQAVEMTAGGVLQIEYGARRGDQGEALPALQPDDLDVSLGRQSRKPTSYHPLSRLIGKLTVSSTNP